MQSTALLTVLGLFFVGVGVVVISFAMLLGIVLLLAGIGLIGASIWLRMSS